MSIFLGEFILSSGAYTKRESGPGFMLKYASKMHRLQFLLSTTSELWSIEFNIKKSTWVHLMFVWKRTLGLVLYENGEFLTKDNTSDNVHNPSIGKSYQILKVGDPQVLLKRTPAGGRFEIGHIVIWIRCLVAEEIRTKAFMAVVKQNSQSTHCCKKKHSKYNL